MKKFTSILISVLYLFITTGFTLNMHYCSGELESISIFSRQNNCCCGGGEMENNCCNNKQFFLQFDADQKVIAPNVLSFEQYKFIKIEKHVLFDYEASEVELQNMFHSNLPPPPKQAIWKTNCTFLFYG